MQFDPVGVLRQPRFSVVVEPVEGGVVDDEEDLATGIRVDELKQELVEGVPVEDLSEPIGKLRRIELDSAIDVPRLAVAEGVDAGLYSDPRPRLVQGAVEPEARLVLEENYSSALSSFFFISGSRWESQ